MIMQQQYKRLSVASTSTREGYDQPYHYNQLYKSLVRPHLNPAQKHGLQPTRKTESY